MKKRVVYSLIVLVVLLPIVFLFIQSAMSKRPDNLGVTDGRLAACPNSPNCVSTQATDAQHKIEPYSYDGSPEEAIERLKAAIATLPRIEIVTEEANYIHAEATSLLFRFVDDVEFYVNPGEKRIDFRSASRVGYSDLGANRSRMESIRQAFEETGSNE